MSEYKSKTSLENLGNALERLGEALLEGDSNPLFVDGTIQRFEFAIELFWKTLKRFLAQEGIQAQTPREALQKAYQVHWIHDETAWLQMLKDRNETSHIYDQATAHRIYEHISLYYPQLKETYEFLKNKLEKHL